MQIKKTEINYLPIQGHLNLIFDSTNVDFNTDECYVRLLGMNQLLLVREGNSVIALIEIFESEVVFFSWDNFPKKELKKVKEKMKAYIRLLFFKNLEYFHDTRIEEHHFSNFSFKISTEEMRLRFEDFMKYQIATNQQAQKNMLN